MNARTRLALALSAAVVALALVAGPALAADLTVAAPADLAVEQTPAGDDDHRIPLVDTPRDRFGLILLVLLFIGGGLALINARKQLRGERDQATGEFRWR